ncbi:hypothetical protein RKLH11_151 [Rhodobacteraceae bacterium KLH11]|nr:hypothetical protein RKLH11_151 [Rhodobacteraceae bacterium KLH11]
MSMISVGDVSIAWAHSTGLMGRNLIGLPYHVYERLHML